MPTCGETSRLSFVSLRLLIGVPPSRVFRRQEQTEANGDQQNQVAGHGVPLQQVCGDKAQYRAGGEHWKNSQVRNPSVHAFTFADRAFSASALSSAVFFSVMRSPEWPNTKTSALWTRSFSRVHGFLLCEEHTKRNRFQFCRSDRARRAFCCSAKLGLAPWLSIR